MKFKEWIKIIIWIAVFQIIGFVLGMSTQANLHPWYDTLNKSPLTPPDFVFSVVWSILYVILAIVGWALWKNRHNLKIKLFVYVYFIQLIMNWAWTPFFFQFHWLGFSFFWIVIMVFLTGIIIINVLTEKKMIALALVPYFLWLMFAAYLNGVIWMAN